MQPHPEERSPPANDWVTLYTTSSPIDFYSSTHLADASDGSIVLTLPDITGIPGLAYNFKRIDFNAGNTVTLVGTEGQTFDGETSFVLEINDSVSFVSYGDSWHAFDRKDALAVTYTPEVSAEWSAEPSSVQDAVDHLGHVIGTLAIRILQGTGSPEGVVVGSPGFMYLNIAGGSGATLWVKESGTLTNTGWAAVSTTPATTTPIVSPVAAVTEEPKSIEAVAPIPTVEVPVEGAGKRWYFF